MVSRKLMDTLFDGHGQSMAAFPLRVVYTIQERTAFDVPVQILVSVPKKHFKHAVDRNHVKRQVREAYRLHKDILYDVLPADQQFKLTEALSLALVDLLSPFTFHLSPFIKWPNDIYVGGKKICGTLISTHLTTHHSSFITHHSSLITSAICGIGLNVNQCDFPDWVPNPTSLALLTGKHDACQTSTIPIIVLIMKTS